MKILEPNAKPSGGLGWSGYPSGSLETIGTKLSQGIHEPAIPSEGGISTSAFNTLDLYYGIQEGGETHLHLYLELVEAREVEARVFVGGKEERFERFTHSGWQKYGPFTLPSGELEVNLGAKGGNGIARVLACYVVLGSETPPLGPGKEGPSGWHSGGPRDTRIRMRAGERPPGLRELRQGTTRTAAAVVFVLIAVLILWTIMNLLVAGALRKAASSRRGK